ncbi:hypothetical protein QUA71_27795 [Microcoleus sp. MON1_C5]|uniref:hypothetical protein n=1 Tax=Microcoleus sp. MON1_C5 TaxID=2818828 RepID=UPI002FD4D448
MKEAFLERRDASKAGLPLRTRKLDQAARTAWLYYIAGNTQEEIAAKLNVSRQAAHLYRWVERLSRLPCAWHI